MAYVEAINCLFIVCYLFAFLFIASRFVSSPTARDHTNVRPVTVTVTTWVTALLTARRQAQVTTSSRRYPHFMRIIYGHYLLRIVFLHSQFQLHTASVYIVLISRANLPIVQSTILPHVQKPHRKMIQWVIRVILFLAEKQYPNYELLFAVDEGKSRSSLLFTLQFFSARKTCQISFGSSN